MAHVWLAVLVVGALAARAQSQGPRVFDDELYADVLDPELCRKQLSSLRAYEFYDASFRIPNGILKGDVVSLGNYEQCLRIEQDNGDGLVRGKYCMATLTGQDALLPDLAGDSWGEPATWSWLNVSRATQHLQKYEKVIQKLVSSTGSDNALLRESSPATVPALSLALCVPRACAVADVLAAAGAGAAPPPALVEQYCRLPGDKPLAAADYVAIVIFSIIGILTILSTAYDLHYTFVLKKDPKVASKLYSSCSIYTNTNRLLTFSKTAGTLDCLDGIRSVATLWIILFHVYVNYHAVYSLNLAEALEWLSKKRAIWFMSSGVCVDTFYTMSGLLLVYSAANKMTPTKLVKNLHWFYLARLLRLFPLLACSVLLQASVFFHVTDGPNTWALSAQVARCRRYWWAALLHVQNWVNPSEKCVPQTWYVSVDVQLHILSPLLLFWALRGRRSAWSAFTVGLVAVLVGNVVYCFLNHFRNPSTAYRNLYYYNTLVRAPPFIVGMIFGYFLHTMRGKKVRMSSGVVVVGYLLATLASSYSMCQDYPDWSSQTVVNLNYSFEKTLWAMSLCWLIFACVYGYGGPVNWFLSLNMWKFFGRISYAMYLFHFPVMYMHSGSFTTPFYLSMENMFFTFAGATVYTTLVSVVACVLVDTPFSSLLRLIMPAF